jgi:hypothetical protein
MITAVETQPRRETLLQKVIAAMAKSEPEDFGIKQSMAEFTDDMVNRFNTRYRGQWTIDELLLHPREALLFCDEVRHAMGNFVVPDHFILRAILARRKNP